MQVIKKIWAWLWAPSARPLALLLIIGVIFGAGGWITLNGVLSLTNKNEFCISCHEMKWVYEEYKESVHYKNRSGVRATCADCHVPQADSVGGWFDKMQAKMAASTEVFHHVLGTYDTKEKFDAGKWEMAQRVWAKMKARDSKECLNCHNFEAMDAEEQDRKAQKRHARAREEGKHCMDCHTGVAHEEPEEPEEPEEK